ncbi:MAG TPA: hypothetical protein VMH87_12185 [Pseudomonadales bacterium]|nr:hypothetical protein [Pseudomonadales bacterium]
MNPAPQAIAINSSGDLFVGTGFGNGNEAITEIAPNGKQSTFATGLGYIGGLAFDGAGNLFEADSGSGNIYKFTPVGVRSTFASGLGNIGELAFNDAGDLFETDSGAGTVNQFTPSGVESTFTTGLNGPVGLVMQPMSMPGLTTGLGGDGLQFNTVSNVIADHISAMWSSNNDLSVLNSTNVTVQWSVISDTFAGTNLPASSGALVRYGSGPVSLHHNLFADNYTGSPHLGDNVTLDFVNNVVYNWVTNAGYATNDIAANPSGYTNYLNYICNYLIAGPNTFSTNIAFWSYTTNTWIFQTNNLIDGDKVGFLNGANIQWNMFTNSPGYLGLNTQTNQFLLPPVSVDETYLAYEKVLDFAGTSMFRREPAETNIVENVRRQAGSIVGAPGLLPTNTSTLIYVNTSQDGIPDFWKITFGQVVTNTYNNFALDNSGYSELEEFDNWLAGPHVLTITNQPVGVNLQKLFGKTGNLSFFLTNSIHGFAYLTNVLDTYTNNGPYSNSIAMFYPTNVAGSGTNYSGFASFDVYVTNNDTVANFGPVTVNVFVSAVGTSSSQIVGTLLPDPVTNNIGPFTIQWYQIYVPTNAVAATNTLLFAGSPMNVWYDTNYPPLVLSPGSAQLLTGVTNGIAIVYTNNVPSLIQGGIYYLGIQNTNNVSTTYAVGLDFDLIGATPLTGGSPVTNTVPGNTAQYYSVTVPSHAIAATNILLYATGGSVDLWFNQTVLPTFGGPGDSELLAGFSGTTPGIGNPILTLASAPPLVPGSTYYLAVNNTGGSPVDYAIEVDFLLYYTPPILPDITNQFAVAGTTFTVDDTATDTNAGTLFYSLTTLPPVGATIDSSTGIITWNVPTNQPAGNILFTTIVTNSFTAQSATNSFTVTVIPEGGGTGPQTNTVPTNSINWIVVNVPTNAIWATNILLYATNFPVNVLFTTNFPPSTNGAYTLMFDETNGISILGLNTYPTNIVPGGTYYLGVQNTNNVAVNYAIEVDFALNVLFGPPFSQTLPATHVTGTSAQLNGFATPGATLATAWFEWGPGTNYLFSTPLQSVSGGNSVLLVTNSISGLLAKQVYHYRLDVSNALGVAYGPDQLFGVGGVSVWGENLGGVTNLPISLTNEVAVAAEVQNGVALNNQGQVTVWGDDTFGQNEVPTNLTDVSSIAAGNGSYALALQDGIVTGWGDDSSGQINVPAGLSNVVEMAAGEFHGLALQNDGTVVAWGANGYGQTTVPVGLSNVVSIAAGSVNSLALLNNGTVVAWGGGKSNTGTFPNYGQSIVPAGLTNVVAIAAYGYTTTALKSDGTVIAWGENNFNQTNVPAGLNSVVDIANGLYHSLALKENGHAIGWGNNVYGEATVPAGLTNIYAISGGNYFSMALESPLSINLNITPIIDGVPQTNTIAANSVIYYIVPVPTNAIAATNLLSFDTAPLNIWFNQTNLPQPATPPDFLLLGGVFGGTSNILTASSTPPLVPGAPYYLAIQNTNSMAVSYVFGVNFDLVQPPPNTNTIFDITIIHTNIGGTNGFLLEWYAPTNDSFQVQETGSLQPVSWNTFSNIVTYTGPLTPTNGLFTFFDDGSQYPFNTLMRFYQVVLLTQTNNNTVPPGGITWLPINVPTNAIWATNILSSATGPLNVWFTTNSAPTTNSGATVLMSSLASGVSILGTNTTPTNIVPGGTYYIGIANPGATTVTYNFTVNFDLVQSPPPAIPPFNSITYTNVGGTNGFLLTWYAPTDEVFQVQETDSLQPVSWNTFSNIVTYTGPLTSTNGLFTFFDNGSEYPFSTFRYYQIVLLSQSNTIPTGTVRWLTINVPTNAIWATNILSSASTPLNVWFTTNSSPTTNSGATVLMSGLANGVSILGTNTATAPTNIAPGGTYYIGLANTGASAATYNFTVNFDLVQPPPAVIPPFNTITYTNNGFLLTWYAPTAEVFQVQETSSLQPVLWNTFSNIITYTGPQVMTNGLFTFFDNGSQFAFGPIRIYQLLLASGTGESLTLPALSNYTVNNTQAMAVTNKAVDSNPSAILNYSLAVFPAAIPSPAINSGTGIINWIPAASEAGSEFKFTTVVTNNSSPVLKATNAFTVFVMPAPSITNALVTATNTTLSWVAPTNDLFQMEWTTNLIPVQVWSTFPPTITSTTGSFSFTDTNKPVAMKFYRLIWLPLP